MVTNEQEREIRKATRRLIIKYLDAAAGGSDKASFMQKLWKNYPTNGEMIISCDEINRIVQILKGFDKGF